MGLHGDPSPGAGEGRVAYDCQQKSVSLDEAREMALILASRWHACEPFVHTATQPLPTALEIECF